MARSNGTATSASDLETRLAAAERMITILLSILNRDIVRNRPGMPGASYQQIMTSEQGLATHEEVGEIETWLTGQR